MLRGRYRWVICALLFVATTINYIDRQVIGLLKPDLQKLFMWSERDYAAIVFTFQLAYAIGLVLAGRVMDKLGTKKGFALAILLWSVAAIGHAFANYMPGLRFPTLNLDERTGVTFVTLGGAAAGFALARFFLGLGEAGNFPAVDQDRRRMVPAQGAGPRHRHLQLGHQHRRAGHAAGGAAGSRCGAGRRPFVATGLLGFFWLALWLGHLRPPRSASARQRRGAGAASRAIRRSR